MGAGNSPPEDGGRRSSCSARERPGRRGSTAWSRGLPHSMRLGGRPLRLIPTVSNARSETTSAAHFDAQLTRMRDLGGPDLPGSSQAMRDVVWSTAVQHGPDTDNIAAAARRVPYGPTLALRKPSCGKSTLNGPAVSLERPPGTPAKKQKPFGYCPWDVIPKSHLRDTDKSGESFYGTNGEHELGFRGRGGDHRHASQGRTSSAGLRCVGGHGSQLWSASRNQGSRPGRSGGAQRPSAGASARGARWSRIEPEIWAAPCAAACERSRQGTVARGTQRPAFQPHGRLSPLRPKRPDADQVAGKRLGSLLGR